MAVRWGPRASGAAQLLGLSTHLKLWSGRQAARARAPIRLVSQIASSPSAAEEERASARRADMRSAAATRDRRRDAPPASPRRTPPRSASGSAASDEPRGPASMPSSSSLHLQRPASSSPTSPPHTPPKHDSTVAEATQPAAGPSGLRGPAPLPPSTQKLVERASDQIFHATLDCWGNVKATQEAVRRVLEGLPPATWEHVARLAVVRVANNLWDRATLKHLQRTSRETAALLAALYYLGVPVGADAAAPALRAHLAAGDVSAWRVELARYERARSAPPGVPTPTAASAARLQTFIAVGHCIQGDLEAARTAMASIPERYPWALLHAVQFIAFTELLQHKRAAVVGLFRELIRERTEALYRKPGIRPIVFDWARRAFESAGPDRFEPAAEAIFDSLHQLPRTSDVTNRERAFAFDARNAAVSSAAKVAAARSDVPLPALLRFCRFVCPWGPPVLFGEGPFEPRAEYKTGGIDSHFATALAERFFVEALKAEDPRLVSKAAEALRYAAAVASPAAVPSIARLVPLAWRFEPEGQAAARDAWRLCGPRALASPPGKTLDNARELAVRLAELECGRAGGASEPAEAERRLAEAEAACGELAACAGLGDEARARIADARRTGALLVPAAFEGALEAAREGLAFRRLDGLQERLGALARTARAGAAAERTAAVIHEAAGRGMLEGAVAAALECALRARVGQHELAADAMDRAERLYAELRRSGATGPEADRTQAAVRGMYGWSMAQVLAGTRSGADNAERRSAASRCARAAEQIAARAAAAGAPVDAALIAALSRAYLEAGEPRNAQRAYDRFRSTLAADGGGGGGARGRT